MKLHLTAQLRSPPRDRHPRRGAPCGQRGESSAEALAVAARVAGAGVLAATAQPGRGRVHLGEAAGEGAGAEEGAGTGVVGPQLATGVRRAKVLVEKYLLGIVLYGENQAKRKD